jgi:hypothetical protein
MLKVYAGSIQSTSMFTAFVRTGHIAYSLEGSLTLLRELLKPSYIVRATHVAEFR